MDRDIQFTDADLEQLLVEHDREEPFLVARRPLDAQQPSEEIDEQILAGLVTPGV